MVLSPRKYDRPYPNNLLTFISRASSRFDHEADLIRNRAEEFAWATEVNIRLNLFKSKWLWLLSRSVFANLTLLTILLVVSKTPAETVEHVLRSFDHENKEGLSELAVTSLDVTEDDDVIERAQSLLGREISDEEAFRLRTLVRFFYSRRDLYGEFGGVSGKMVGTL
jgi:hypothetical protein